VGSQEGRKELLVVERSGVAAHAAHVHEHVPSIEEEEEEDEEEEEEKEEEDGCI